jgi:hypothetical protein
MNTKLNRILAEISAGELVDKITILEIKKEKISNNEKLLEINKELNALLDTLKKSNINIDSIKPLWAELKNINLSLWNIEDGKREAEKKKEFGENFIELARKVYKINDQRADVKSKINKSLGSNIREVKSYY